MSHAWLLPLIYSSPVAHQLADLEKAREERKIEMTKPITSAGSSLSSAAGELVATPTEGGVYTILLFFANP